MNLKKVYIKLLGTLSTAVGVMIVLFLSSEQQVHYNNAFSRRYPPHPIIKKYYMDLGFNSYYIAGADKNNLYLGNSTAPWHLLQVDLNTKDTFHLKLIPQNRDLSYRSLQIKVLSPYFFVMDGTIPFILRGRLGEWRADPWMYGRAYFSKALPIDSNRIMIRTISTQTQRATLGMITREQGVSVHLDTTILKPSIDGIMDVDGELNYAHDTNMAGYLHFYTNEFLVMDNTLSQIIRRTTIDTTKWAQIRLAKKSREQGVQISAPPVIISNTGAIADDLMFINSDRLGKNEPNNNLEEIAIIDVYNWKKGTYEFSFSLNHTKKEKLREFDIVGNRLVSMQGNKLGIYHMVEKYFISNK
ncbi:MULTISPECIES: hypothetical protein [Flagellimonas]|uniref:TolB-like 6-blade propeller-like n=1 Tax=Flagellimonas zhangzhouensis TaxID=1073328 RepID=A0A1H2RCM3_9FLAO|nr:hypothetical protein [Allomuricauda zhangzhouensis]SDQ62254.1 hypothetical protein SAMN05216294_1939 [Allomuricauda zhangzhouensis]SDW17223.1 hypothetical protein SAMN04487892_0589 [Allomuricauda zhangzhouensis]